MEGVEVLTVESGTLATRSGPGSTLDLFSLAIFDFCDLAGRGVKFAFVKPATLSRAFRFEDVLASRLPLFAFGFPEPMFADINW